MKPNVVHFKTPGDFRAWLEKHHASAAELWIGYYKKASGKGGMVYAQALDEALCYGWIDGLVRTLDGERYAQRFTPRRRGSIWSRINVGHVARLTAAGRMQPSGLAAFAARDEKKTGLYSFERTKPAELPPDFARRFRANRAAWAFFQAQPPSYRRAAIHRVLFGKQLATRERWLERLIDHSAHGRRLSAFEPSGTAPKSAASPAPRTAAQKPRRR